RYADRSAVVGDRGLAGPGATVRHKAPVKAGGGDRDAATTRGRDGRRSRERDGLAAAHGPRALRRNSEEEAWADPRLSDGGARPGLSHRRPGAGMRRAIHDATAWGGALAPPQARPRRASAAVARSLQSGGVAASQPRTAAASCRIPGAGGRSRRPPPGAAASAPPICSAAQREPRGADTSSSRTEAWNSAG